MRISAICIVLLLLSFVAKGATTSFVCKFAIEASPNGIAKQASPFELRFVSDSETKKAYLIGNNGSSEVHAIPNTSGVSFVEVTASGNVMVTAITSPGEAVHSRNSIMGGKLIPSQFYGTCAIQ